MNIIGFPKFQILSHITECEIYINLQLEIIIIIYAQNLQHRSQFNKDRFLFLFNSSINLTGVLVKYKPSCSSFQTFIGVVHKMKQVFPS